MIMDTHIGLGGSGFNIGLAGLFAWWAAGRLAAPERSLNFMAESVLRQTTKTAAR
jgi:hypothetical protein